MTGGVHHKQTTSITDAHLFVAVLPPGAGYLFLVTGTHFYLL
jgi:hypothetical protein